MDHNYVQKFGKLLFSKDETISPNLLTNLFSEAFSSFSGKHASLHQFSFFSNNYSIRLDSLATM